MKTYLKIVFNLMLFIACQTFGQYEDFVIPDSLSKYKYLELYRKFQHSVKDNPQKAKIYAFSFLQKGTQDKNNSRRAWGFYMLAVLDKDNDEKALTYLDNAIHLSRDHPDSFFPTILFINKGSIYKNQGNLKDALSNYIEGNEYAKKSKNTNYVYVTKHNIALLKRKLGKYDDATSLLKECLVFEQNKKNKTKNDSLSYLMTLSELITTYRYRKHNDSASVLNKKAIGFSDYKEINFLFEINEGIFQYQQENYAKALSLLKGSLPSFYIPENRYFFEKYQLIDAYLYLSKTYSALSEFELANQYYKKTDSILQLSNYKIPENNEVYLDIIAHFKSIDDKENQLFYINKMLALDSILDNEYRIINEKITEDYDVPNLIAEKEKLIASINSKNSNYQNLTLILISIILLALGLLFYQYRKRKLQIEKFNLFVKNEEIRAKALANTLETKTNSSSKNNTVPEDVMLKISQKLENFEQSQDFRALNITTTTLANAFNTNSKYISQSVHYLKKKSFTQYINDLRLDYIINRIKTDKKIRNYTIKSLATESGFNNAQSFSTHFRNKVGVYPSFFIKRVSKTMDCK